MTLSVKYDSKYKFDITHFQIYKRQITCQHICDRLKKGEKEICEELCRTKVKFVITGAVIGRKIRGQSQSISPNQLRKI